MKKFSQSRVAHLLVSAVNIPKWIDFDRTKSFTVYFYDCIKKIFVPQKGTESNTFEQAVQEYGLTDAILLQRQKGYFTACFIMCICALLFFGYSIYHVVLGSWRAVLISFVMTLLSLTLAFRYHFWFYQIKQRKLGCTFREWFRCGLLGGDK